jgi:hypothetical protein
MRGWMVDGGVASQTRSRSKLLLAAERPVVVLKKLLLIEEGAGKI